MPSKRRKGSGATHRGCRKRALKRAKLLEHKKPYKWIDPLRVVKPVQADDTSHAAPELPVPAEPRSVSGVSALANAWTLTGPDEDWESLSETSSTGRRARRRMFGSALAALHDDKPSLTVDQRCEIAAARVVAYFTAKRQIGKAAP
jgi:hypothetical protein